MKKGIDVSVHQGDVNWSEVGNTEVEFAIIRAGYGREIYQKDAQFENNYNGCRLNNIPLGAYWYSYAKTVQDAEQEARTCIEAIRGKIFEYPIYFDIEDKIQSVLSKQLISEIAATFCNRLESAGYWAGIYSYKNFLEEKLTPEVRARYSVWVAHIGVEKTDYEYQYEMWQYSHTGRINGINGDVDFNYCYADYPEMIKNAGLNGYGKTQIAIPKYTEHVVKKNESLWGIAEEYLGDGRRYPEIKHLNNLNSDVIYVGQVLKIAENN